MKSVHLPILSRPDELIGLKRAAYEAGKSEKTLRTWCTLYGIGRQVSPGARIEISRPALEMVLNGDLLALELLRGGHRSDPKVARYFDFLGLQI